jgi:hypothetical protein
MHEGASCTIGILLSCDRRREGINTSINIGAFTGTDLGLLWLVRLRVSCS